MIKGRREVFSERLEGKQGLGMTWRQSKCVSRQPGRGAGVTKPALFLFWLLHQQLQIKKEKKNRKKKGVDGRWHAEWPGTMFKRCLGLSLERYSAAS